MIMLNHHKNRKKATLSLLIICSLALYLIFFILPIFWMIITSLKPNSEVLEVPPRFIFRPTLHNYLTVLTNPNFARSVKNSTIIAILVTFLTTFCAATSSYAFTRFRLVGGRTISNTILITRMIPAVVLGIPLYIIGHRLRLLDTYFIMIIAITTFALPFQIWMQLGFFSQIPKSLDEAALIDGCSWYKAFWKIILPSASPGLAATAIMTFFFSWNDLFFALVLTRNTTKTAPLTILEYMGYRNFDWAAIMAGGVMLMLPTLLVGFIFQKYLIKGMTAGAVKG